MQRDVKKHDVNKRDWIDFHVKKKRKKKEKRKKKKIEAQSVDTAVRTHFYARAKQLFRRKIQLITIPSIFHLRRDGQAQFVRIRSDKLPTWTGSIRVDFVLRGFIGERTSERSFHIENSSRSCSDKIARVSGLLSFPTSWRAFPLVKPVKFSQIDRWGKSDWKTEKKKSSFLSWIVQNLNLNFHINQKQRKLVFIPLSNY